MSEKRQNAAVQQALPGAQHMPIGEFGGAPTPPGGSFMLSSPMYWFYEVSHAALNPARAYAVAARVYFKTPVTPPSFPTCANSPAPPRELSERSPRRYGRPEWRI